MLACIVPSKILFVAELLIADGTDRLTCLLESTAAVLRSLFAFEIFLVFLCTLSLTLCIIILIQFSLALGGWLQRSGWQLPLASP